MKALRRKFKGFSLVEVILASTVILMITLGLASSLSYSVESTARSNNATIATHLAYEGLEATRNIRDENYSNLTDGTYGLTLTNGRWALIPNEDITNNFVRKITISTISPTSKKASISISWLGKEINLTQEFTTWQNLALVPSRGGLLVYGDGGTTSDEIKYRILSNSGNWSTVQNLADIDSATNNKALVNVRIFSSTTRNEKIIISKHCDGSNTYFYSQIFNGTAWGNVQLLSTFSGCSNNHTENYDGTYLSNGDFVAMYSDDSDIPKYRFWNGSSWSSELSARSVGGVPQWIYLKNRPNTNELMLVTYDNASDTKSQYYNGSSISLLASWSTVTTHSTAGGNIQKDQINFTWSTGAMTKGILIFPQSNNDSTLSAKVFTANGLGGGLWSGVINSNSIGQNWDNLSLVARPNSSEFIACAKDRRSPPLELDCKKVNSAPVWTDTVNGEVGTGLERNTDQVSFEFRFEKDGNEGIVGYADETNFPKFKIYNSASNTFSVEPTNLFTLNGIAKMIRMRPAPDNNDIMILVGDSNHDFYTGVWNGNSNTLYTSPIGKAGTIQGINGYDWDGYYFDFAWDEN